jgi:large subunit ribosomal protein L28
VSKVCERCGKGPVAGRTYARRGLAKSKGGVGRKVTGRTGRRFLPNVQVVRVREANGAVRRMKICARCLRTGLRRGTIEKAPRKPRPPKKAPPPKPPVREEPVELEPTAAEASAVAGESEEASDAAPDAAPEDGLPEAPAAGEPSE